MKNKLFIFMAATTILAGGFASTRLLAADDGSPGLGAGKILQRIADKLGLTSDQRADIRSILVDEKGTLQPLLSQLHRARQDLRENIRASDASEATVRAASAKVAAVEADLAVERMRLYAKIAPVLTDEQRQKIAVFEERTDSLVDEAIARIGAGPDH
jgi:Spy/CpxP family protein refolding chaperone